MPFNNKRLFNRDLSWLRFNHRVLQEAADLRNPLYERIKFLAIFSSNLDEFFEVRVSDIRQIKSLDKTFRKKLISRPNKLLKEIKQQVNIQLAEFQKIFKEQIIPQLEENHTKLLTVNKFSASHKQFAKKFFDENLKDKLVVADSGIFNPLFLENKKLYLVTLTKENKLVWIKIPDNQDRFVTLPKKGEFSQVMFIDDIIKNHYSQIYGTTLYSIEVSRDAELYIDNEYSGNLLEKIQNSLSNRETGQVTRILIDTDMPAKLIKRVNKVLDLNEIDIVKNGQYHHMKDLFSFPNFTNKNVFKALPPKRNANLACQSCLFTAIKEKDWVLSFPYESFEEVIRFVEQAANDESVTDIKITLYRVSGNSTIAKALLSALKKGKNICVFIETKARFDEANNIKWGKILEENGANVLYSYPGIKVHSKILYINRMEKGKSVAYAYIGTGNFNEKTATIYTDLGLLTSNEKITSDLLKVFSVLERKLIIPKVKNLLVSPFNSRATFNKLIEKEIRKAKKGKRARIVLKLNSLQDEELIELLYKANNEGVKIRLLIRGICSLVPGIKGQSENIYITSIVDRFLEHARVYMFGMGREEKMYIGSADWMTRNLDHRIEVITPILDKEVFKKIKKGIEFQLKDKVKSRIVDENQTNTYVNANSKKKSSQHLIYDNI